MHPTGVAERDRSRKETARKAVSLAMNGSWEEAVRLNHSILNEFPRDPEAYNRLGKALSELGRNREAREAFRKALDLSPHNGIARKNLERLTRLGDEDTVTTAPAVASPNLFIEESRASTVTSLVNLAPPSVILKLAPGHRVNLEMDVRSLNVTKSSGEYVGQVEPRLAARLVKLAKGGNRYEANVTSSDEAGLTIIIRESYKHPSQNGVVSFPSRPGTGHRAPAASGGALGYGAGSPGMDVQGEAILVKDWSDDDTEPGDDAAFAPVFHRIINTNGGAEAEDEEF